MALYYSVLHKPRRQHLLTRTFINLQIAPEGPPPSSPQIASPEYNAQREIVSAPLASRFWSGVSEPLNRMRTFEKPLRAQNRSEQNEREVLQFFCPRLFPIRISSRQNEDFWKALGGPE